MQSMTQVDQVLLMKGILISTLMIIANWSTRVLSLCQKITATQKVSGKNLKHIPSVLVKRINQP